MPIRCSARSTDPLDRMRIVPPVFMPERLEKLIDLGREPMPGDVELATAIGGFRSPLPRVPARRFGSTQVAGGDLGAGAQPPGRSARHPDGDRRERRAGQRLRPRLGRRLPSGRCWRGSAAYADEVPDGLGGVVGAAEHRGRRRRGVEPGLQRPGRRQPLLDSGRLAFELKVGQGAKPGLGGMTVLADCRRPTGWPTAYAIDDVLGAARCTGCGAASPGTFTDEILRQQIRLMRNNYPRARVWVKLHPGRDVGARRRGRLGGRRRRGHRRRRRGRHRLGPAGLPGPRRAAAGRVPGPDRRHRRHSDAAPGAVCWPLAGSGRAPGSRSAWRWAPPRRGWAGPRCWRSMRIASQG